MAPTTRLAMVMQLSTRAFRRRFAASRLPLEAGGRTRPARVTLDSPDGPGPHRWYAEPLAALFLDTDAPTSCAKRSLRGLASGAGPRARRLRVVRNALGPADSGKARPVPRSELPRRMQPGIGTVLGLRLHGHSATGIGDQAVQNEGHGRAARDHEQTRLRQAQRDGAQLLTNPSDFCREPGKLDTWARSCRTRPCRLDVFGKTEATRQRGVGEEGDLVDPAAAQGEHHHAPGLRAQVAAERRLAVGT